MGSRRLAPPVFLIVLAVAAAWIAAPTSPPSTVPIHFAPLPPPRIVAPAEAPSPIAAWFARAPVAPVGGLARLFPDRPQSRLVDGEPFFVRLLTPDFPSRPLVDYFTADGRVIHLYPTADAAPLPPFTGLTVGDPAVSDWLTVAPPFGIEHVVVIAPSAPLFASPRPRIEPAAAYLTALAAALAELATPPPAILIELETVPHGS